MENTKNNKTNALTQKAEWTKYFSTGDKSNNLKKYHTWQSLWDKQDRLTEFIRSEPLLHDFEAASEKITAALDYKQPFKIVLVGETGVGKSTLINALIGHKVVPYGDGDVVTGVPIYVHPGAKDAAQKFTITYRNEAEFLDLIAKLLKANDSQVDDLKVKGMEWVSGKEEEFLLWTNNLLAETDTTIQKDILKDVQDIIHAWKNIKKSDLGKEVRVSSLEELKELTGEKTEKNAPGKTSRVIAGIKKADIYFEGESDGNSLNNIVYVDTPGMGDPIRRHEEILRSEVAKADAIILVVGNSRPVRNMSDINLLIQNIFLSGTTKNNSLGRNLLSKIFLVANNREILNESANKAFQSAINNIWDLLQDNLPDNERENRREYFEIIAHLGIFTKIRKGNGNLEETEQTVYDNYIKKYGEEAQNKFSKLLEVSGITKFENAIADFLSRKRIDVMLEEAATRLNLLIADIELHLKKRLSESGINLSLGKNVEKNFDMEEQNLCYAKLEFDKNKLIERYEDTRDQFFERGKDEIFSLLEEKKSKIFKDLEQVIESSYKDFKKRDGKYVKKSFDYNTGSYHWETSPKKYLLHLETQIRLKLASESGQVAAPFISLLESRFSKQFFESLFGDFEYGQEYINEQIDPVGRLEQIKFQLKNKFQESCRACLEYELIQSPILGNEEALLPALQKAFDKTEDGAVIKILQKEFAIKYKAAVEKALPVLEKMHFYEVQTLSEAYYRVIDGMKRLHDQNFKDLKAKLLGMMGNQRESIRGIIACYTKFQEIISENVNATEESAQLEPI